MPLEKLEQKLNNVKGKNKYIYQYINLCTSRDIAQWALSTYLPYNLVWPTWWNAEDKTEKKTICNLFS